ncbi:hypothetical protein N7462_008197 [Penicillium macrosclerotiorum]|uniref:uncharacterized protein n=1 Tax=Penicillium macrosclerotiorum TaxID=303699 RepID=UPI0025466940|nr:uncharacterized protein N7462_008197 [Penicillium macrosclerotiorum]KAJ5679953.1 hypothetical protein N7462_008197 [Penicillium macrosclerotiorum]
MVRGKGVYRRSQDQSARRSMVAYVWNPILYGGAVENSPLIVVQVQSMSEPKNALCRLPSLPCAACVDAGQTCIYSEAERRVSIPESHYRRLQSQARLPHLPHGQSIDRDRPTPSSVSSSTTSAATRYSEGELPMERDDWWYKGADNLRLNPGSTDLAWDVRPLYDDPSSLRRTVTGALPQLPPFEFAKRLFWVQYAYIGTIFSLIHPREFEKRLNFVYHQPPDFSHREKCLIYCQYLLVVAFGLMYSVNQWSGDDGPPGFKYFKHALRLLPDIHEEGSIFFVEVLCYVAYYMQNLNRRDAAFLYIGLALRMAISLGLHQEVSDPEISETDRNRRRRAWWSDGSTSDPWPAIVLTHYTQLSRILGRIGEGMLSVCN